MADYLATVSVAAEVAKAAGAIPGFDEDPVQTLWEKLRTGAEEADRAKTAMDMVVSWIARHESEYFGRHRFLPIDLGVTEEWEPRRGWREIYVLGHSLLGWILIPLLITSLGGIIRRQ